MGYGAAMRSAAAKVAGIGGVLRGAPAAPPASQVYLSSTKSTGCEDQLPADQASVLPLLAKSAETQSSVFNEALVTYPVPKHAIQAFKLLSQSPAAQSIVASIASDPNVLNACMQNEALTNFLQSQNSSSQFPCVEPKVEESSDDWKLPSTGCEDQLPADQASVLPLLAKSAETQSSVINEALVTYPVPKHAVQAFKLLSQSPAAQSVVASIASDPNVWNAFMQNEALTDFLQSQNSSSQFPCVKPKVEESSDDALSDDWKPPRKFEEISEGGHENGFGTILQNIKLTVEEMVSNISSFLGNIFSPPSAEKTSPNNEGNAGLFNEKAFSASVMWLALLAIIVVLIRRG